MRIVSFLPSATEMVCALGLTDQLVGVTHECDFPESIQNKPVVVRNAQDFAQASVTEIDRIVSERRRTGASLYMVDESRLRELEPDLILTQDLCQVCAPSGNEVSHALQRLPKRPTILWLTPHTLAGIEDNLRSIGQATGTLEKAEAVIQEGHRRFEAIRTRTEGLRQRPRVFCLEWVDPIYGSGHWIPEMVRIAGGEDALGRLGEDSRRVEWEKVLAWNPDVLLIMPCGFKLAAAIDQTKSLIQRPGWSRLAAVQKNQVFAVDANAYFARPGPRVVDGTELLAHLIHPGLFPWTSKQKPFAQIIERRVFDHA